MNFARITDKDALYFLPLNEQEGPIQPIQAMEGARYVFTEQESVDASQAIAAERIDNDLYLRLRPESESSSSILVKDFFQFQGSVHSLSETGEYRLHLSADSATPAGPVALGSEYLGMQQDQPEAAHLKVMQQAVTFQTLDQLAESLNPSTEPAVEPLSASLTPSAEPVPSAQEAEPKLLMAAMSETGAPFAAIPSITGLYDQVGSKQGQLPSGSVTDDKQPRLTGLAEPNTTLDILLNGVVIDTASVDGQGNWSYTPKVPLEEGGQLFFVRDQSTGKTSGNVVLIIDTVAPARAVLSDVSANTSGADLTIAKNGLTNDNTPTLTGKAEANSLVIIYNDKTPIASIYADQNGNWSWTALFLPDGTYALKVAAMDHSGNVGLASSKYTITIDATPPDAPSIDKVVDDAGAKTGDLAPGEITDDTTPTLKGKGEPGGTVIILDNGEELGRVVVGPEGTWEFTPETELADGEHAITAIVEDLAGNQSKQSPPWVININASTPDAPTIGKAEDNEGIKTGDLASGDVTDDRTPTLSGMSEAGSTVVIFDNGVEIGRVTAGTDGAWTFTPETELAEGEHSFTVQAINAAGNLSDSSDAFELVIDITAPLDPIIDEILDNQGDIQGPIDNGGLTDDTTPTLKGQGEPGDTVIVLDNGEELGRVVVGPEGTWEFTPETELTDGEHSISVIMEDPAGNQSKESPPWVINIDATAPNAPTIDKVVDDAGTRTGDLTSGDVTDDTTPTLSGMAEKGATVVIYVNDVEIDRVTADPVTGAWAYTPTEEKKLGEGEHRINVRAIDTAGNVSDPSETFELVIDTTAPVDPGIDPDGPGISEILDNQGDIQGPIDNGGLTDDTTPTLKGKGEPGDTVIILDNGEELGRVVVGPEGTWEFTPETELADGEHGISVIMEDPAGNQSKESPEWVINVDATAPDAPTIGKAEDNEGIKTGDLASGDVTDDRTPTLSGTSEAGSTVVILDNGVEIGRVIAGTDGAWTFTPETELAEGEHSFTVQAIDAAGNLSGSSDAFELVIDITAPLDPSIDEIFDNQGDIQGPIDNGGLTDDATPTLKGKGEPGDTVIILDNGEELGRVVVGPEGTWEFTPETELADGEHSISVIMEDPAGNQSKESPPWVINVDATAPDAPTIGKVEDNEGIKTGDLASGDVTDDRTPTLSGTSEAGSTVVILDNGVEIGRVIAGTDGAWTFTPETELAEGEHSFTVQAIDAAGNLSGSSDAFELVIDLAPPAQPVIESVYDDAGDVTGELSPGDVTDDKRPVFSGQSEPLVTVIIYNDGVEIGRGQADAEGKWSIEATNDLVDGVYNFTAVAENAAGTSSEPSEPFEVILYTGNGPHQVARLSHMGKDSGQDGQDFVTDNGSFGRLMHGVLSAELAAGQSLQVSTDGGKTWFDALVKGTDWAAQDLNAHSGSWTIQTRVMGADGKTGFVMEQQVVLDTTASRAPSSIQIEGSNLLVAFDPSDVAVGDRIAVIADGGAQRFEYTLTEVDIIAGSVSLEVGAISSASAALVDQAGNLSGYANTGSNPSVNSVLTGDVSEVYGTTKDNVFTIGDVSVLQDIKVIEGNAGVDTLKLAGANQVLDLSAWQGRLSSIEVIDITGSGDNTLKISLGDVLDLGHLGFFHGDPTVQLAVKGDAGDTVILNNLLPNGMDVGEWENLGTVEPAGITYEVYRNEALAVDILVQEGVTVQF